MSRVWLKIARFTKIALVVLVVFIFAGGILSLAVQSYTSANSNLPSPPESVGSIIGPGVGPGKGGTGGIGPGPGGGAVDFSSNNSSRGPTYASFSEFSNYIQTVLNYGWGMAAALAVLMIVLGGYSYMMSGGGEGAAAGKEMIWYALAGLALLALAGVFGLVGGTFPGENSFLGGALKLLQGGG